MKKLLLLVTLFVLFSSSMALAYKIQPLPTVRKIQEPRTVKAEPLEPLVVIGTIDPVTESLRKIASDQQSMDLMAFPGTEKKLKFPKD